MKIKLKTKPWPKFIACNKRSRSSIVVDRVVAGLGLDLPVLYLTRKIRISHNEFVRWLAQSQSEPEKNINELKIKRGRSSRLRKPKKEREEAAWKKSLQRNLFHQWPVSPPVVRPTNYKKCVYLSDCLLKVIIIIVDKVRVSRLFVLLLTF